MMDTRPTQVADQIQNVVLQAAMDEAVRKDSGVENANANANENDSQIRSGNEKKRSVSPRSGAPTPPGRPKGVRNKLTNLRDAVIEAFDRVGGADYLVRLAEGTQSDRAAFVSLMNKVLPTQVQANVDGGIKLELSWLSARNIGTATAQLPEQRTQVLDLQQESNGTYRIIDPNTADGWHKQAADAEGHTQQKPAEGDGAA